jgi:hypothetical protein
MRIVIDQSITGHHQHHLLPSRVQRPVPENYSRDPRCWIALRFHQVWGLRGSVFALARGWCDQQGMLCQTRDSKSPVTSMVFSLYHALYDSKMPGSAALCLQFSIKDLSKTRVWARGVLASCDQRAGPSRNELMADTVLTYPRS